MGVGPPGRTGRDQLSGVRAFVAATHPGPRDVVVIACDRGAGGVASGGGLALPGVHVWPVSCAGNLHTSVIEFLVRAGAGGVVIVSCPPRDCSNREGPKWLEQRLYHEREAELQERVDRRRVLLVHAGRGERGAVISAIARLRSDLEALERLTREDAIDVVRECEMDAAVERP
jgi:coenzyme F420-reducing hydrogenase delta subunit